MDDADLIARVVVAGLLGAVLGAEREVHGQAAGIRTHALVALGAALFTVAGAYGFADIARGQNTEPARIAAQVAAGIGFIGGGAILKSGASVRGLTTAATLWMSAAVGVTAGSGAWALTVACGAIVPLVLIGLGVVKPLLRRLGGALVVVQVDYARGHGTLGPITDALEEAATEIRNVEISDDDDGRRAQLRVVARDHDALDRAVAAIRALDEVRTARWRTVSEEG